jgi:hypothetical protein
MIENLKIDCIDSLAFGLHRTAIWRKKMAVQYPTDSRNGRAAECLESLAVDANKLSDELWSQLKPYSGWASKSWREAISKTARMVGFQHKITDVPTFVDTLVGVLRS